MRRLPLAAACTFLATMASIASTQIASAQNPHGYAPNMMGPGGTPPGIHPGAAQYHAAIPAPPRPKLPPGVRDDGGLLFFNGKPYQDPGPFGGQQMGGVQQASYQAEAPSVMSPAQQYAANTQGYAEGYPEGGDCNSCNGNCGDPYCTNCGRPGLCHSLFAWLGGHGRGFPGKMGSVWSAGGELVYFTREHGPDRSLVLDTGSLDTVLSAQDLSYDYEPGFRTWITYMGPSGIAAQFIYLQTYNMDSSLSASGNNDLQIPFPLAADTAIPSFFSANRMTLSNETDFNSFEANVVYPWSSLQLLAGFRYVGVDERSSIFARDTDAATSGVYGVDSRNRLYGGQIGVLGQYEAFGLFNFDFVAKTGLFGNATFQHQIITEQGEVFRDTSGSDDDVAYVSELNARAVFPLGPTFTIQAGYDVLFLNRLALATQQYDFENTASSGTAVSGGRNLIIHGVSGGITAKW